MLISNIITKFLLLSFVSFVYVHWKADINRLSMLRVIYLLILPIASIAILSQMLRFNDFDNPISIIMCVFGIVGLFIGNIYSFTFFPIHRTPGDSSIMVVTSLLDRECG